MKLKLIFTAFTTLTGILISIGATMNNDQLPNFLKLWDYYQPEQSRVKFENLLKEIPENAPLDYILEVKTQIARTYSLSSKFEQAHEVLDRIESRLNENTPKAKARYLLERGRTFNSSGDKSTANELFKVAYNYSVEIDQAGLAIDAAHMVAIASQSFEQKLEWNKKGLAQALHSKEKKLQSWAAVFYNNMGWDFFDAKDYTAALENFKNSYEQYNKIGATDEASIARWSTAKAHRLLGNLEIALEIQSDLLKNGNGEDPSGYTFEELGEIYLALDQKEESKIYFKKAYEVLSKDPWLVENEPQRINRLKKLSI